MKNEAYYALKIEELREKPNNPSPVEKGLDEDDGMYQIWSSRSTDKDMLHLMNVLD